MSTVVIVGAQWGDEAKGKMVDLFGSQADMVVRYTGGNNAGHTIVVGGEQIKFHLVPAGILHPNATAVIASDVVVDPKGLVEELCLLRKTHPNLGRLCVSSAAHVVLPYHRLLDKLEEEARGEHKIGTTLRGIGPAYQDKVARIGIRMGEFVRPEIFETRLREVLSYKNHLLQLFGGQPLDFRGVLDEFTEYAEELRPLVADTDRIISEAVKSGKRVLFEGAHGAFLDLDSPSYPYVTSSHPTAGGACIGTGIGPRDIDSVLGVCKAYTTRVGAGPFPTELHNDIGERIRKEGQEFGTTTGRPRRCGWLDLVLLRQSCLANSIMGLVVTRLDVLSGIPELKIATSYRRNGERIDHVPIDRFDFAEVEPEYTDAKGWTEPLRTTRKLEDLPAAARDYLERIETFTQTPIAVVSVGPDREETILVRPDLVWA